MAAANKQPTNKHKTEDAKKQFFVGLFDMSWRLVAMFLLPVAIGIWIDGLNNGKGNTFTLIGIVVGVVGSIFVIRKVVSDYSKQGGNE